MSAPVRSPVTGMLPQRKTQHGTNEKARSFGDRAFSSYGLAVTYFRVRMHTIIGANPFHGPVRDGKVWFQAAVAARLALGPTCRESSLDAGRCSEENETWDELLLARRQTTVLKDSRL